MTQLRLVLATLVAALALTACGGKEEGKPAADAKPAAAPAATAPAAAPAAHGRARPLRPG